MSATVARPLPPSLRSTTSTVPSWRSRNVFALLVARRVRACRPLDPHAPTGHHLCSCVPRRPTFRPRLRTVVPRRPGDSDARRPRRSTRPLVIRTHHVDARQPEAHPLLERPLVSDVARCRRSGRPCYCKCRMLSDNDGMEDGHPAAGAPAVGIVPEAAELVFAPLLDPHRDDDGQYSTNSRRKRVQQEPQFPVIELDTLEPTQCYADGADVPTVFASPHLCSGHGGTRCKIWRIRGPVRGYNDAGWRLSTVTIVRARASLPPHEVYVRSVRWLVPGTYVDTPDVYNSA